MGAISSVIFLTVMLGYFLERMIKMVTFLDSSVRTEKHFNTFND
jgi:hypothetical protein